MAYTTEAIVRVESPFKDSSNIDTTYVTRAIAQADNLIDGVIGEVYSLPLSETPGLIQDLSTQLAVYNLYKDQNTNIEIASGVDFTDALEEAMNLLESIRTRKIKLFDSTGSELSLTDRVKPKFYPTQASTDDGDTEPLFTINKQF